jgi:hypothetical protein
MSTFDKRIDAYIVKSADFAVPVTSYTKRVPTFLKPRSGVSLILNITAPSFAAWPLSSNIVLLDSGSHHK